MRYRGRAAAAARPGVETLRPDGGQDSAPPPGELPSATGEGRKAGGEARYLSAGPDSSILASRPSFAVRRAALPLRYFNVPAWLWHGQKAPAQRLVLDIVLAQGERGDRLGHLVAQVEGVRRVDGLALPHLGEQLRGILPL